MKDTPDKKLKEYETMLVTWNKGRHGKYKILRKNNKKAFNLSTFSRK